MLLMAIYIMVFCILIWVTYYALGKITLPGPLREIITILLALVFLYILLRRLGIAV